MCPDDRIAVKYCDSSREAFTVMYNQFTCANLVFSLVAQGTNKPFSVVLFELSCQSCWAGVYNRSLVAFRMLVHVETVPPLSSHLN